MYVPGRFFEGRKWEQPSVEGCKAEQPSAEGLKEGRPSGEGRPEAVGRWEVPSALLKRMLDALAFTTLSIFFLTVCSRQRNSPVGNGGFAPCIPGFRVSDAGRLWFAMAAGAGGAYHARGRVDIA